MLTQVIVWRYWLVLLVLEVQTETAVGDAAICAYLIIHIISVVVVVVEIKGEVLS